MFSLLYSYEISTQNTSSQPNLNNSFMQHYEPAKSLQLKLGLRVCPDCQQDHIKAAQADTSFWKDY